MIDETILCPLPNCGGEMVASKIVPTAGHCNTCGRAFCYADLDEIRAAFAEQSERIREQTSSFEELEEAARAVLDQYTLRMLPQILNNPEVVRLCEILMGGK